MQDLTACLLVIVKTDVRRVREVSSEVDFASSSGITYEADLTAPPAVGAQVAEILGGSLAGSSCVVIDKFWDPYEWHGRRRVEAYAVEKGAPLALLDPRVDANSDWAS